MVGKVDWRRFYRKAVLEFGVSPTDFFRMRPREFWWLMPDLKPAPGLTARDIENQKLLIAEFKRRKAD